jgi:hypothetical protein
MAIDTTQPAFDAPISGMSLTAEVGSRPWQSPAQFTTVDEAIEFYMDRMATEQFYEQAVEVMEMGVPVTTIANTMQMAGVMEGKHSIDVGMLVTPLIMEMLMLIAEEENIDYDDGLTEIKDNKTSDSTLDKLRNEMKQKIDEVKEEEVEIEEESTGLMARRK